MDYKDVIEKYRTENKLSQTEMADMLGISQQVYSNIVGGKKKKLDAGFIVKYKEVTGIDLLEPSPNQTNEYEYEYINAEKALVNGDPIKENHIRLRLSLKNGKKLTPINNFKGAAGQIIIINDNPELILEWIDIPFLKDVQGTVEVFGHSMEPKYPNGSRVAVKFLEHKRLIRPGEDYFLIDVNYEGYIKRLYLVRDNEDLVELRSYNEDKEQYPDFVRKWDEILYVFKVRAGIQLT